MTAGKAIARILVSPHRMPWLVKRIQRGFERLLSFVPSAVSPVHFTLRVTHRILPCMSSMALAARRRAPQLRRPDVVTTYRHQLFKGPNDLDFDADGNLYFTDPWGTGAGPEPADMTGPVYQYSKDGVLRRIISTGSFPNGIAISPDNNTLAIGDFASNRVLYYAFLRGPAPAWARRAGWRLVERRMVAAPLGHFTLMRFRRV
jgi:sugar lactone lactonase YvrE